MDPEDIKNKIIDIAKQSDSKLSRSQKLEQMTDLLRETFGSQAELKATEMLVKFRTWEDYIMTIICEGILRGPEPESASAINNTNMFHSQNTSKYFDLIQFYKLYKEKFDEITDEEIKDGILKTKQLKETADKKKKMGEDHCEIYRVNVATFFVHDSNRTFITVSRLIAVLGYMNAFRGLKAISSLAKQIYWDSCSYKIQERKYLFFNGCEHLLASIIMGSGPEFDQDDVAFLYGATTLVEYLTYYNVYKKKNPSTNVENIPRIDEWLVLEPPTNYSFKKKYPELETILKNQLDEERQCIVENMLKNATVKRKIPEHERRNVLFDFPRRRNRSDSTERSRHIWASHFSSYLLDYDYDSSD